MPSPEETEIHRRLAALLAGQLPFDVFWDWLLPLQRTLPGGSPERLLLLRIIAKFDEYDSSAMSDERLRAYLAELLPPSYQQQLPRTSATDPTGVHAGPA